MSELDETLARWRRETEKVKPSAALMVELNALAVAQTTTPAAGSGAKAVATKAAVVVIAVAALGVVGLLLLLPREGAPVSQVQPSPAQVAPNNDATPLTDSPANLQPKLDPAPAAPAPAAPAVLPKRSRPVSLVAAAPAVSPERSLPVDLVAVPPKPTAPPMPARFARAAESLPFTCAGQRDVLAELIREHAHEDSEAAAAAFARWTLLCRTLSGPALDTHPWLWPWGLPSGTGSSCKTDVNEPSCGDGEHVSASIESAAMCVSQTTPGTCARRAARIQAVFAACERLLHQPGRGARSAVDDTVKQLTDEFGPELTAAAWCLNPAAEAEGLRIRARR